MEYFPGFNTLPLSQEFKSLMLRLDETPENFYRKDHLHVDVQQHLMVIKKQQDRMRVKCQTRFSTCKKIWSGAGQWSFLGPGSEKKWCSISEDSSQGEWDKIGEKVMVTLAESGHPVLRATSPLSRGQLKSKGGGQLSIHYRASQDTITTVFRTISSVNQLSLYGAVAEMCEEYESFHDRTEKPVVGGQSSSSFMPSVIKTNVPLMMIVHMKKFYCHNRILFGKKSSFGSKVRHNTELWTKIDGEPMEFEWNLFPGFTTLQLCNKVQEFLS